MRPTFVKTQNYQRFMGALEALEARGASECCLVVVDGPPGLGKTTILSRWAADNACVYLRAKVEWSPYWMLGELLKAMRIDPPHGYEKRFGAALQALGERAHGAELANRDFAVVIDEADHISARGKLVDTVRDVSDVCEVPFILVGMGRIRDNLSRFPQTMSRICRHVRFEPSDRADVQRFLDEQCEVKVAADLAEFVAKVTGGFNREVREAIVAIERFGFRTSPGEDGLTMADMSGELLVNDRRTGQAVHVPQAH